MEYFGIYLLIIVAVVIEVGVADSSTCVVGETSSLRACFDPLKEDLDKASPADINNFLCGNQQKQRVECIIKKFKMCPQFKNETFLDELKHTASGFHVKDLFYVDSSDSFCKCAPTFKCLGKVDTKQMVVMSEESKAWNKMPNHAYICGAGKSHLECVSKSLPDCDLYLQYKHNQTVGKTYFDVTNILHAALYSEKHCGDDKDLEADYVCINKRAKWYALSECVENARLYTTDDDKSCGLRRCIEINMGTCPVSEMNYYIEAVNVFSDFKVNTEPCASATLLLSTISTILLAFCMTLAM